MAKLNTNSNTYIIAYSCIMVVIVAFLLAFVSSTLKPTQDINVALDKKKQILAALNIRNLSNEESAQKYAEVVNADAIIDAEGNIVEKGEKGGEQTGFKLNSADYKEGKLAIYDCTVDGKQKYVVPVYGMGLWGPIWGYIALDEDLQTIVGAYFDHDSETPGLGAKIKDDPSFRAEFIGKKVNVASDPVFSVVKVGTSADENSSVDAITGATMTSKGLGEAIAFWLKAYAPFLSSAAPAKECCGGNGGECDGSKPCCSESSEAGCCSDSSAVKCPVTE